MTRVGGTSAVLIVGGRSFAIDGVTITASDRPRCAGSLPPCARCGKVHARRNGSTYVMTDPRTGARTRVVWFCSID